jgi:hypothetical protein
MVFTSSREQPQFEILKQVKARSTGPHYVVMNRGAKLKQSADLDEALSIFDRPIKLVSG